MNEIKDIIIKGLTQNNLKNISLTIPRGKIVVFTGVSGSGKSSIVFDTIAAESQRQMNETYTAFVRGRMPKYEKPQVELIDNLTASVIVDQSRLGGNIRSTVGTISDLYASLRLLFSRIGQPYVGTASYFSFNDPNGMCKTCAGVGKVATINIDALLDESKSWNEGMVMDSLFNPGSWYWQQYVDSGLFDCNKPLADFTREERNLLLYGAKLKGGERVSKKVEGLFNQFTRLYLNRDLSNMGKHQREKADRLITEEECPDCKGRRLNREALGCWINGYNIADMCEMEFAQLRDVLREIKDPRAQTMVDGLCASLTRMIEIGLPYLHMNRESSSLSGGEAQRLKLVRYMGSSLTGMTYIFDEPSTGMHPRDVHRMNRLLMELRDKGNTVLVVEHDPDVIRIADEIVDVGPLAGRSGGKIVFQGNYEQLLLSGTLTGKAMGTNLPLKNNPRITKEYLSIRGAHLHNLKNVDVDVPLGVMTVVTGVAGSGKSSLISGVFAKQYEDRIVMIDQSPVTATGRSMPATFLGFFDQIRKLFADANGVDASLFSFNSKGACPVCGGKGVLVTELVFMDPVVTECEACGGKRYSDEALMYRYHGKNIVEVLSMTVDDALDFFDDAKIKRALKAMQDTGLAYMTLGQPLSTLSGGERQRIKLAKNINKKGNIYILDEPTTGLHASDVEKLMQLFEKFVMRGNTVIIIEHNLEVIKRADYIIDIGPDGGRNGGHVVFTGTPAQMIERNDTITARCLTYSMDGKALSDEQIAELMAMSAHGDSAGSNHGCLTDGSQEDSSGFEEENDMERMKLMPIGRISKDAEGNCSVLLDKKYIPAMKGLEGYSHLQVIWWFDRCDNDVDRNMTSEEKPYTNGPDVVGTFATRSPQRPNPIAVSNAGLIWMDAEHAVIGLDYIDADNGTPVLDIKPYTPSVDRVGAPKVPDWCKHWPDSVEKSGDFNWENEFNF